MKRAWTYLLVLCLLLPCAADAAKARDASGVTVSGGRLWGDIVGVSGESGETALALRVDCPVPPEFTPEQLAVLTTEWIVPDETAVGEAMRATGADWSDGALKRFGPAFAAGSAAPLSPAASGTDAEGARERARATALSFLLRSTLFLTAPVDDWPHDATGEHRRRHARSEHRRHDGERQQRDERHDRRRADAHGERGLVLGLGLRRRIDREALGFDGAGKP